MLLITHSPGPHTYLGERQVDAARHKAHDQREKEREREGQKKERERKKGKTARERERELILANGLAPWAEAIISHLLTHTNRATHPSVVR